MNALRLIKDLQQGDYCRVENQKGNRFVGYVLKLTAPSTANGIKMTDVTVALFNQTQDKWLSETIALQVVQKGVDEPMVLPPEWSLGTMGETTGIIPAALYLAKPPVYWKSVVDEVSELFKTIDDSGKSTQKMLHRLVELLQEAYTASEKPKYDVFNTCFSDLDLINTDPIETVLHYCWRQKLDDNFADALIDKLVGVAYSIGETDGNDDEGERD